MAHRIRKHAALALLAVAAIASTGCIQTLLATGIYMWNGGNVVPAEFDGLEGERVVVIVRPPASYEYRNAGAARAIGAQISYLLAEHVKRIDVVNPREVDNWVDEEDWENFKDLGRSVKATRILHIELDEFDLYQSSTIYRGTADVAITVYDMTASGKDVFNRRIGQILFPRNSGIPAADKPVQQFERQFVGIVATQIAEHFYKHNPNADFAIDAVANE